MRGLTIIIAGFTCALTILSSWYFYVHLFPWVICFWIGFIFIGIGGLIERAHETEADLEYLRAQIKEYGINL